MRTSNENLVHHLLYHIFYDSNATGTNNMHILTLGKSANGFQKQLGKSTEHKVISDY